MTGVLETRGLTKRFGGIVVADDINLTLSAKRIVGLIGPNGAGKTSLFNLLTGVEKPDAGSITFNGKPLARVRTHERARLGLSRTWQNLRLFPSLTLLDNLLVAPRHYAGREPVQLLFDAQRSQECREGKPREGDGHSRADWARRTGASRRPLILPSVNKSSLVWRGR